MKILISKGRKDVRSREDNRNRMESNIKIASRIIIFFNKMRYVIRYVGFRDVIISIHVEKKRKIRGGFNILLLDSGRKILNFFNIISTKKDTISNLAMAFNFFPPKRHSWSLFPTYSMILWGDSFFMPYTILYLPSAWNLHISTR